MRNSRPRKQNPEAANFGAGKAMLTRQLSREVLR